MNKSILISILFFILSFSIISCSNNSDINKTNETDNFPKLQIINNAQITVLKVVLDGYEFSDLNLKQTQSIILDLNNGMPGGYKDVQVSVRYRPYRVTNSAIPPILTKLDFADGKITTLTIN